MRTIPLSQGYRASVDDADYAELSKYSWHVDIHPKSGVMYVTRSTYVMVDGVYRTRKVRMHHQIMGRRDGLTIDHKNRNTLDNCRENLRWATRAQNAINRVHRNTTGYRGVNRTSKYSNMRWAAAIHSNKVGKHLGQFQRKIDAARAYDAAAKILHGEFAVLNFPNT